jgi:D-alanyl-D-alanine carboxypeptidase
MKHFVDNYGYGLMKVPFEKYWGFGHTGGIDDFSSVLFYFPDLKTAVAFTANQSDMDTNQISIKMIETALGRDFKMPSFTTLGDSGKCFRNTWELTHVRKFL